MLELSITPIALFPVAVNDMVANPNPNIDTYLPPHRTAPHRTPLLDGTWYSWLVARGSWLVAPLQRCEKKEFYYVTTTDDPVMEKLAVDATGNVFATDAILAHLMASPRTMYPWDIVVQKVGEYCLSREFLSASCCIDPCWLH